MKSSAGTHYIALDHVRALASFIVFTWHFTHIGDARGLPLPNGYPIRFDYVPSVFPMALLDEGHTGVALFMTLSGYLFAKLLDGKKIKYTAFLYNRALRLLPLLLVIFALAGIKYHFAGGNIYAYIFHLIEGIALPTLPNGAWSITIEAHYYICIPLVLWMIRTSSILPVGLILCAITLRLQIYLLDWDIQYLAYLTIIGRIDQFVLGILAYRYRNVLMGRHALIATILLVFAYLYYWFDCIGGYWHYPAPDYSVGLNETGAMWIILPTVEGLAYAAFIAWYDTSFMHSIKGFW